MLVSWIRPQVLAVHTSDASFVLALMLALLSGNYATRCEILRTLRKKPMKPADFRRIALSLEGVEEYDHAGFPAFRVGGRKFASLASQQQGYGNLMLTPEQQAAFVEELREVFLPIPGGFGRMGHTHIRLAAANEDVLTGALRTAWKLRIAQNEKTDRKEKARPRSRR